MKSHVPNAGSSGPVGEYANLNNQHPLQALVGGQTMPPPEFNLEDELNVSENALDLDNAEPDLHARRLPPTELETGTDLGNYLGNDGTSEFGVNENTANYDAHISGLERAVIRSLNSLGHHRPRVLRHARRGMTKEEFEALPRGEQLMRIARKIQTFSSITVLGDPGLINTGARPGTSDTVNLMILVSKANQIFDQIISGIFDDGLAQVFGAENVALAKTRYSKGQSWMNQIAQKDRIVTDRSGYSEEIQLGGLTYFQNKIALNTNAIDNPTDPTSVVLMIHEALHAGNNEVKDYGYIGSPAFTQVASDVKLNNAAHYEVVPRRILNAPNNYAGIVFTPAGEVAQAGGEATAELSPEEKASREASEFFRSAWTIALNLHTVWVYVQQNPASWTHLFELESGDIEYHRAMPFWSKVEGLTVHEKTQVNDASSDVAEHPVSLIDVALSEGLIRRISFAMNSIPGPDQVAAFSKRFQEEENGGDATEPVGGELLAKYVLRSVGPITGDVDRDFRALSLLAHTPWSEIFDHRSPDDFKD